MSKKWEYKIFNDQLVDGSFISKIVATNFSEASLNDLGKEGWELVSIAPQSFITKFPGHTSKLLWVFKRELAG